MTAIGLLERIACPFQVLRGKDHSSAGKNMGSLPSNSGLCWWESKSTDVFFFKCLSMRVSTVKACNVLIHTANLYM